MRPCSGLRVGLYRPEHFTGDDKITVRAAGKSAVMEFDRGLKEAELAFDTALSEVIAIRISADRTQPSAVEGDIRQLSAILHHVELLQ